MSMKRDVSRLAARSVLCAASLALAWLIPTACDTDPLHSHEIIKQLQSGDVYTRTQAADAIGRLLVIEPNHSDAVHALIRALDDSVPVVQSAASGALSSAALRSPGALPLLTQTLHDTLHPRARAAAAEVLGRVGTNATLEVVITLGAAMHDPAPAVRVAAADALRRIGPRARTVLPAIAGSVADSVTEVRRAAANAATAIDPSAAVSQKFFVQLARDSSAEVRLAAINGIGADSIPTAEELDQLTASLRDSDAAVRARAKSALDASRPRRN